MTTQQLSNMKEMREAHESFIAFTKRIADKVRDRNLSGHSIACSSTLVYISHNDIIVAFKDDTVKHMNEYRVDNATVSARCHSDACAIIADYSDLYKLDLVGPSVFKFTVRDPALVKYDAFKDYDTFISAKMPAGCSNDELLKQISSMMLMSAVITEVYTNTMRADECIAIAPTKYS